MIINLKRFSKFTLKKSNYNMEIFTRNENKYYIKLQALRFKIESIIHQKILLINLRDHQFKQLSSLNLNH